jgi:hypothetical protein
MPPFRVIALPIALLLIPPTFAFGETQTPPKNPSGGLFQGTVEEQTACAPDATRFCIEEIPDTFRVLACLQANRQKLRKACLRVLETHGM